MNADKRRPGWNYVEKLLSVASEPILPSQPMGFSFSDSQAVGGLFEILRLRNGFYAFESALHVFPLGSQTGTMDLESWNSQELWRNSFGDKLKGNLFFAEDVLGVQFYFAGKRICTFDPDTGVTKDLCGTVEEWAQCIMEDFHSLTGYPLANEWQVLNGPLPAGLRLYPKIPFVLGGEFKVENLYAGDPVERMNFYGSLAAQTKDLPNGTKVQQKVGR